jgi:hypothetical protein
VREQLPNPQWKSPAKAGLWCIVISDAAPPKSGVHEERHFTFPATHHAWPEPPAAGDIHTLAWNFARSATGTCVGVLCDAGLIFRLVPAQVKHFVEATGKICTVHGNSDSSLTIFGKPIR